MLPGDFIQLVQEDLKLLRSDIDESYILKTSKKSFKTEVKKKIRQAAFEYLKNIQKHIQKYVI